MQSKAATVKQYLDSLPADREASVSAVRKVILDNLPKDFEEGMQYGMIGYYIPHRVFPDGYHCDPKQPLPFAGLASQKGHLSVYLMSVYGDDEVRKFRADWAKTGKKLDIGKCCIRFKSPDALALDVIGREIKRQSALEYIAYYQKNLLANSKTAAKKAAARTKASAKSGATSRKPAKSSRAKVRS